MAAGLAAENAELVLHAEHVGVVEVQEIRRAPVGVDLAVVQLETHRGRIIVTAGPVVHRQSEALHVGKHGGDGVQKVSGEGRDATLARHVVAEKCHAMKTGICIHEKLPGSRPE